MARFQPRWLPLAMGSLPHEDVSTAWETVLRDLPSIPSWPQLPRRAYRETMYAQFGERFPGITIEDGRVTSIGAMDLDAGLEQLYLAYLEDEVVRSVAEPYASGLHALLGARGTAGGARRAHITGPISWGLSVVDQNQRPILYDEVLACRGQAPAAQKAWQSVRWPHRQTIVMIDEPIWPPSLLFVSLRANRSSGCSRRSLRAWGIRGVHCCGNTDWSILLASPTSQP